MGGTIFALDGCKLSSNASKEWSGRFNDLKKKKEKIEKKVSRLLEEQVNEDKRSDDDHGKGQYDLDQGTNGLDHGIGEMPQVHHLIHQNHLHV